MELNSDRISQNYQSILEDIKKYSPYPEKVKILFVSKYLNIEEQETLINMGYSYFGENRAQVYRDKMERFSSEKYENLIWDFIGRLQKNKIKYIITNINLIHSIDSFDLLTEINKKAVENDKTINGLIQINVSKEESKTGIYIEDFQKESEKYCWKYLNMEMILMKWMNLLQTSTGHTLMKFKNTIIQDTEEDQSTVVTEFQHLEFLQMCQWEQ